MTKRQALIVADGPTFQGWLEEAAGDELEIARVRAEPDLVLTRLAADRADIIFCEFDGVDLARRSALIEQLVEKYPLTPVVGLGTSDTPEWVLSAMRAGARDFFVLGRDDASVSSQIDRLMRRATSAVPVARAAAKPGQIFSILSAHPHESIAFFAEHIALALNESLGADQRVLLVDLATPAGAAAIFLNLTQTYNLLDAVGDAHRCDQTLVDTAFTRHGSGIYVLSLPEDLIGRPSVNTEDLLHLLRVLGGLFTYTIVALDGQLPVPLLAGVANLSDRLLLLSDQSILKSRHNKYLLRALRHEDCSLSKAGLVVDNYRRRLGLEPANLAELFDLPLVATLQSESYNRVVSMNSGEPLFTLARKDPFWLGVKQLADALVSGETAGKTETQGLLKRFLR